MSTYHHTKRTPTSGSSLTTYRNQDIGRVFGQLLIQSFAGYVGGSNLYRCRCTCGGERTVSLTNLLSGRVRACHDCARRPAFTLAASLRNYTAADFKREWQKWYAAFTLKQHGAFNAKLRDWAGGLTVRLVPNDVRAELVAEVMTTWLARTLEACRKGRWRDGPYKADPVLSHSARAHQ